MRHPPRLALLLLVAACGPDEPASRSRSGVLPDGVGVMPAATRSFEVQQEAGGRVVWILPGHRALDAEVFGTPDEPARTARLEDAAKAERELVQEVPWLVGLPERSRERAAAEDGGAWTTSKGPTPFSNAAVTVDGTLRARLVDRVDGDGTGPFDQSADDADVTATFSDPAGHRYALRWEGTVQAPIPGWETGGGVVLGQRLYGISGTGSPLLPTSLAFGATWGRVDVEVDGRVLVEDALAHVATTQAVRDRSGRLALDADLPLPVDETAGGRSHQTHLVVYPIALSAEGPVHQPLEIPYLGQDGEPQPWIHVAWLDEVILHTTPEPEAPYVRDRGGDPRDDVPG